MSEVWPRPKPVGVETREGRKAGEGNRGKEGWQIRLCQKSQEKVSSLPLSWWRSFRCVDKEPLNATANT